MPMSREEHESLLNELINPELEQSRRTEILQLMRVDYGTVIDEHTDNTNRITDLQKDNSDLVVANSKLFRQMGIQADPDAKKQEEQKNFSETITLESLEGK